MVDILPSFRHWLITLMSLLMMCLSQATLADQVTVALDKTSVSENEPVQLTIRTDFSNTGNGPDLSVLKRDFDILSQSQNSQFSFNLGTNQALSFWVVSLMPKAIGRFEIPSIQVGDKFSDPMTVEVKPAQQMTDKNGNSLIMLKFRADQFDPYIQQQVILTLELYTAVTLQSANLTTPNHPNIITERLSDDQMRYEQINGSSYQIMTRQYIAFPQRSGTLEITNQTLEAMVNTRNGVRKITVKSPPLTLNVLPIPASYGSNNWMPTDAIAIKSEITESPENARVGDTLVWEINATAQGILGEQLPSVTFNSTRSYKLYPSSPKFETLKSSNGVTGHESIRVEVVPTMAGKLELPSIELPYWDPMARAMKTAKSDPIILDIAPLPIVDENNTNQAAENHTIPPQSSSVAPISLAKAKPEPKPQAEPQQSKDEPNKIDVVLQTNNQGFSLSSIIAATLIFIGVFGLVLWTWLKRRSSKESSSEVPTLEEFAPLISSNEPIAYQRLLETCRNHDLSTLRLSLLEWARHRWGDSAIRGLEDIKRLVNTPHLTQLLMEAELVMYSASAATHWNGDALADAIEEYVTGQPKPSQASKLQALYPNF